MLIYIITNYTIFLEIISALFFLITAFILGYEFLIGFISILFVIINIQILKITNFPIFGEIACGIVFYPFIYLTGTIINEVYGEKKATKVIYFSFYTQAFLITGIVITKLYPTKDKQIDDAIWLIFSPTIRFFIASLGAFISGFLVDIFFLNKLREYFKSKHFILRVNLSNIISGLVDPLVFNLLAWKILAFDKLEMREILQLYFYPGYSSRVLITLIFSPLIYLMIKNKISKINQ